MPNILVAVLSFFLINETINGLAIPLSVKNSITSISRINVPVQMGIPFPKSKLMPADVSKLTVSDSITGAAIPVV